MAKGVVACPGCGQKNRVPATARGVPKCGKCHKPLPWIVDATDANFGEVADRAPVPVLVDLWAPWCGPCRMVSPALAKLATDMAGRFKLVKVNVDKSPKLARRFDARSIPTLVFADRGREVSRRIGALPPPQLRSWVEQSLTQTGKGTGAAR